MEIGQQIYDTIISNCGDIKSVKGVTEQALKNMRDGKNYPSLKLLKTIFEQNNIPAEIVITVKNEGKKGKTKIKL